MNRDEWEDRKAEWDALNKTEQTATRCGSYRAYLECGKESEYGFDEIWVWHEDGGGKSELSDEQREVLDYETYTEYLVVGKITEKEFDRLSQDWENVDTDALEHESYDEYREVYREGYCDGLASQAYEEAAYGLPDDPYYGPEYPTFRDDYWD